MGEGRERLVRSEYGLSERSWGERVGGRVERREMRVVGFEGLDDRSSSVKESR